MSLITCPDCSNQVSDHAPACPKCGRPMYHELTASERVVTEREERNAIGQERARPGTPASVAQQIGKTGAWCPNCHNRDSFKTTSGRGCAFWIFVFISMGLALVMIPFLPKTWHCRVFKNEWKA